MSSPSSLLRIARPPGVLAAVVLAALVAFASETAVAQASAPVVAPVVVAPAVPHVSASVTAPAASTSHVTTGGPRWNELNATQKSVLTPLAGDWDTLDARSKERWLDVAGRFHKLPPEEQQRANQRMAGWAHMTVAQRTQARLNFQESRGVSKEEREARWKAYQALPDDKKRELAKRAAPPASGVLANVNATRRRPAASLESVQPKKNVVGALPTGRAASEPVGTGAAAREGATTTLLTRRASPPKHQHDGQPKIAAGPGWVDRTTLLPKRGPQAPLGVPASAPVAAMPAAPLVSPLRAHP